MGQNRFSGELWGSWAIPLIRKKVKAPLPRTPVRLPRKVLLSDPRNHSLNYRRGDRLILTSSCEGPSARAFSEHFSGRAFCGLLFAYYLQSAAARRAVEGAPVAAPG